LLAVALSKEMPFLSMTPHLWNTMALHPSFLTHCCLHAATFPAFVRMSLPMARPHAPKSSPPSMLKFFFSVHPTPAVRRLAAWRREGRGCEDRNEENHTRHGVCACLLLCVCWESEGSDGE